MKLTLGPFRGLGIQLNFEIRSYRLPFAEPNALIASDMNNVLRGLGKDFSDKSVTGTTDPTTLQTVTIPGGTMTATGSLFFFAAGTVTGTAAVKTVKLNWGGTTIVDLLVANGEADWYLEGQIHNTTTNKQRIAFTFSNHVDAFNFHHGLGSATLDTNADQDLLVQATLGSGSDTITGKLFMVQVQQIT